MINDWNDWKEDIKDIHARLVILEEINKNLVIITEELRTMLFFIESQNNKIDGGKKNGVEGMD